MRIIIPVLTPSARASIRRIQAGLTSGQGARRLATRTFPCERARLRSLTASISFPLLTVHGKKIRCVSTARPTGRRRLCGAPSAASAVATRRRVRRKDKTKPKPASHVAILRPGDYSGAPPPVPMPNTAVKRPSANGTSSQDAGE